MPDCAPIMSNADKKTVGWASCSDGCKNCPKCIPDPTTSCGQLMLAAGYDCAPESCHSMCCKSGTVTSDSKPQPVTGSETGQNASSWRLSKKNMILVALVAICLAMLLFFLLKN